MNYGVPVVSTRCGGPEDFIIDGETGLLVPVGDAHKMADAIISLLEDRKLRDELATAGAELVARDYSSDEVFSRLNGCIHKLLGVAL